ncbi:hypothetical protein A3D76_06315 [Candidatus Roizmanbacteria bacterium RIFCSPHIGHO2_02_FULL_37_9b]|nr:MAG: hypothetical protein A3D76_06315 [Candidatus Roizmanbacteria bacterium RIFCSPHIGHO2_02_FULL_37_9b]
MNKNIILTGSLAFDYIFDIPDPFTKYILPTQIHKINVSIVTDSHRRSNGGTAGNQAFYLARLGLSPMIFTTAGNDFNDYKKFLKKNRVITNYIKINNNLPTAAGFVMTDPKDNQIWMFATGAMKDAKNLKLNSSRLARTLKNSFILISPTELTAMSNYVKDCVKLNLDFAFDPAFFIPHFSPEILSLGVKKAKIIFGNDYEIAFMEKRLNQKITGLINKDQIVVKTLGDKGSEIFQNGKWIKIPVYKTKTVDPTGAGDAYRAGFLFGYLQSLPVKTCGLMGAVTASFAVEIKGTMNLKFNKNNFKVRLSKIK